MLLWANELTGFDAEPALDAVRLLARSVKADPALADVIEVCNGAQDRWEHDKFREQQAWASADEPVLSAEQKAARARALALKLRSVPDMDGVVLRGAVGRGDG